MEKVLLRRTLKNNQGGLMQQATDNIWEWLKGDNAKVVKVIKKSVWIKRLKPALK